jgi:hypothetical protein
MCITYPDTMICSCGWNGGIYAVFPDSEYTVNGKGKTVPTIPAGTVFYNRPAEQARNPRTPGHAGQPGQPSHAHSGIEPTVRLASQLDSRSAVHGPVGAVRTMF